MGIKKDCIQFRKKNVSHKDVDYGHLSSFIYNLLIYLVIHAKIEQDVSIELEKLLPCRWANWLNINSFLPLVGELIWQLI